MSAKFHEATGDKEGRRPLRTLRWLLVLVVWATLPCCDWCCGGMGDWGGPRGYLRLQSALVETRAPMAPATQPALPIAAEQSEPLLPASSTNGGTSVFLIQGEHRLRLTLRECRWEDYVTEVALEIEETGSPELSAELRLRGVRLVVTKKLRARQPSFDIGARDTPLEPLAIRLYPWYDMEPLTPNEVAIAATGNPRMAQMQVEFLGGTEYDSNLGRFVPLSDDVQLHRTKPLPLVTGEPVKVTAYFYCNHVWEALFTLPIIMPDTGVDKEVQLKLVYDPSQPHLF